MSEFQEALNQRFQPQVFFSRLGYVTFLGLAGDLFSVIGLGLAQRLGGGMNARFFAAVGADEFGSAFFTAPNREGGLTPKNIGLDLFEGSLTRGAMLLLIPRGIQSPLRWLLLGGSMLMGSMISRFLSHLLFDQPDNPFRQNSYGLLLEFFDTMLLLGQGRARTHFLDLQKVGQKWVTSLKAYRPLPSVGQGASPSILMMAGDDQPPFASWRPSELGTVKLVAEYTFIREVGRGAAGKVFQAIEKGTDRVVAVKVLDVDKLIEKIKRETGGEITREEIIRRIERERQIQGKKEIKGIVRIYNSAWESGRLLIVMEYLPKGTLAEHLERNGESFELKEILELATQLVWAVSGAHQEGLIHYDLKPENVFLTDRGGRLQLKVGDFGIAKTVEEAAHEKAEGGTPEYAPLEAFEKSAGDQRWDVYSLGAILYQMLTGTLPFGERSPEGSVRGLYLRLKTEEPIPPSKVRTERKIPEALDRVVMRALSKNPEDRYKNAGEMLTDLLLVKAEALWYQADRIIEDARRLHEDQLAKQEQIQKLHTRAQGRRDNALELALAEARRLEEEVEDLKDERRELISTAKGFMGRALEAGAAVFAEYEAEGIRRWLIEKQFARNQLADFGIRGLDDFGGDEEEIRRTREALERQIPDAKPGTFESRIIGIVTRRPYYEFVIDGAIPTGARPRLNILKLESRAGKFVPSGLVYSTPITEPRIVLDHVLERGAYAVQMTDERGFLYPVQIPLPPWPEKYTLRIPAYPKELIPPRWLVIPAGYGRVRTEPGSFTERLPEAEWRGVPRDIAFGPMIDNGQWLQFLLKYRAENPTVSGDELLQMAPRYWHPHLSAMIAGGKRVPERDLIDQMERPIHPRVAVSYLDVRHVDEGYFRIVHPQRGLRRPTPDEWRRGLYGNDSRSWSDGDSRPSRAGYNWRFARPRRPGIRATVIQDPAEVRPNDRPPRRGDLSPFSVTDPEGRPIIPLPWLASGLEKALTNDDPDRFMPATGREPSEAANRLLLGGASFSSDVHDLEILSAPLLASEEAIGEIGFLQAIVLREGAELMTPNLPDIVPP